MKKHAFIGKTRLPPPDPFLPPRQIGSSVKMYVFYSYNISNI